MAITVLTSTESGANSLTDINANFADLDTTKADLASPTFTGTATIPTALISGLTASELVATDGSKNLQSLAVATYPSLTELSYVKGVTSALQTQINAKGSGTVTAIGVTTANGVSGSSSGGATPNLTITLGAITPSTVNGNTITTGTGTLTLGAGKTLTASNTITLTATDGSTLAIGTGGTLGTAAYTASTAYATSTQGTTADNALPKAGGTMSGNITLGENTSIALDPAGSADGKYSGITVTGTAGYTQAFGDLVYLDPTDSRWEACDANSASGADGDSRGIIGMVVSAGTDGNACTILLNGIIRADAKFPTFTVNNPIYVSETAGAVTQTQPTTTDVVIRIVGAALTTDEMYFNPDNTWTTHT